MYQARLKVPRSSSLVGRRGFHGLDAQRAQRGKEVILLGKVQRSPFQQIESIDILDDSAVFQVRLHGRHGGELGYRVIELALRTDFQDLEDGRCQQPLRETYFKHV